MKQLLVALVIFVLFAVVASSFPTKQQFSKTSKRAWPEHVGKDGESVAVTLKKEYPDFRIHVVRPGERVTKDLRMDRIRVFIDEEGKITTPPSIG